MRMTGSAIGSANSGKLEVNFEFNGSSRAARRPVNGPQVGIAQ